MKRRITSQMSLILHPFHPHPLLEWHTRFWTLSPLNHPDLKSLREHLHACSLPGKEQQCWLQAATLSLHSSSILLPPNRSTECRVWTLTILSLRQAYCKSLQRRSLINRNEQTRRQETLLMSLSSKRLEIVLLLDPIHALLNSLPLGQPHSLNHPPPFNPLRPSLKPQHLAILLPSPKRKSLLVISFKSGPARCSRRSKYCCSCTQRRLKIHQL